MHLKFANYKASKEWHDNPLFSRKKGEAVIDSEAKENTHSFFACLMGSITTRLDFPFWKIPISYNDSASLFVSYIAKLFHELFYLILNSLLKHFSSSISNDLLKRLLKFRFLFILLHERTPYFYGKFLQVPKGTLFGSQTQLLSISQHKPLQNAWVSPLILFVQPIAIKHHEHVTILKAAEAFEPGKGEECNLSFIMREYVNYPVSTKSFLMELSLLTDDLDDALRKIA